MKSIRRSFLLAQLGIVPIIFAWAAQAQDIKPEAVSDFKWFSGLGFPDLKSSPYVRVATGRSFQMGDETPEEQHLNGFLIATNGATFRILTGSLWNEAFTNNVDETNEYKQVRVEVLDLNAEAGILLRSLKTPPAQADELQTFVMAWACWRHGLDAMADQLYEQAQKLPPRREEDGTTNSFHESIEKEMASMMMWQAVLGFGDPSVSRPQLLKLFNVIVTNYPHSEHHDRAVKTAGLLQKMIAEDEAHAKTAPTNLDLLPVEVRVRELIFRLRDQNGHQDSQPGLCDIFDDWRRPHDTNTPAHQLVRLGYAAFPQLIAALDDKTFTRSVGFHRNFYFSHNVLTVGDCAAAIMRRISGTSFFIPRYTSSYMSKDEKESDTRKAAEAWWAEFQKKGEKQMLVDGLNSPGDDAPTQAELLCQRYPDAAAETLIRGIRACSNDWIRVPLIHQIGQIDDPKVFAFLNEEMTGSPTLSCRVMVAYEFRRTGKGQPVAAMIQEWEKLAGQKQRYVADGDEEVIQFLASSDSPEAIHALREGLRQYPAWARSKVVEAAGESDTNQFEFPPARPISPATLTAIEELLVQELEDIDDYGDPRICDTAGKYLAKRWPDRYAFDITASLLVRNRQRIQCLNVWRQAHTLPLLPVPQPRSIHVKPEQATVVTTIEWAGDSVKPDEAFTKVIDGFKDKPLTADGIVALFTGYAGRLVPQTAGLQFRATKGEDLTGVALLVRLIPGDSPDWSKNCSVWERGVLGGKSLYSGGGGGPIHEYADMNSWQHITNFVNQALAGKPETPFEISVQIRQ